MRKMFVLAGILVAVNAAANPLQTWRWEIGGAYRTADGHGAVIERRIDPLNGGEPVLIVHIIETPAPSKTRWKHSTDFTVSPLDSLGEWRPAYVCFTGPREYVGENTMTIEADRYTSFVPCPVIPIQ